MSNDSNTNLTLYFAPGSSSRVVIVALEECGAAYALKHISILQGQTRSPEYLAVNGKGKVPLLVSAHGSLSENVAIAAWLDATHPQASLLPPTSNPWQRAQAVSWLAWSASTLQPMLYRARFNGRIHPDTAAHPTIKATALAEMADQLGVAEKALADGRPWLMGERWCLADAHLSWLTDRANQTGLELGPFPKLAALMARQQQRPAWLRMVAKETEAAK